MANNFLATTEFLESLDVTEQVGLSISAPDAIKPSHLPVTNAISCATVVLISGYFENFLKNIVKEYINNLNLLGKPLTAIPINMQLRHFSGGADALNWASKEDKSLGSTLVSQDLSRRLASLSQPTGYILAWEAFANTKSNPGTETVKTILSGLEISQVWYEINSLSSAHGRLDTFLMSFIKMRNICAHTGRHHTPPSGMDIIDYVGKFRGIAESIDMLAAIKLEEFSNP